MYTGVCLCVHEYLCMYTSIHSCTLLHSCLIPALCFFLVSEIGHHFICLTIGCSTPGNGLLHCVPRLKMPFSFRFLPLVIFCIHSWEVQDEKRYPCSGADFLAVRCLPTLFLPWFLSHLKSCYRTLFCLLFSEKLLPSVVHLELSWAKLSGAALRTLLVASSGLQGRSEPTPSLLSSPPLSRLCVLVTNDFFVFCLRSSLGPA